MNNRQADLRRRRHEAGWRELLIWVPIDLMSEVRAMVVARVGKPPGLEPERPIRLPARINRHRVPKT